MRLKSDISIGWSSSGGANSTGADVRLYRGGAGVLEQRSGVNLSDLPQFAATLAASLARLSAPSDSGRQVRSGLLQRVKSRLRDE